MSRRTDTDWPTHKGQDETTTSPAQDKATGKDREKGNHMSESNDAPSMKPAEWLTELLASDLPSVTKIYSVLVASCADENGHVWLDDDGMPIPLEAGPR